MEKYILDNRVIERKNNATQAEFSQIIAEYIEKGYEKKFENSFGGALFCTLSDGNQTINVSYKEKNAMLRIVTENGKNLPFNDKSESVCDTLVTQMQTTFFSLDCGMGYVIRLDDGSFVVIDGGFAEYDEPEHFLDILNQQKINDEIPVVKAWFITHPHGDHYNLLLKMYNDFSDKIKIETLIYNWSTREYSEGWSVAADDVYELSKKINTVIARTGYKFEFGNNVFEIVYSPDDAFPVHFENVNDTSIVIKQVVNDRTILYLADIGTAAADLIETEYDDEFFKAEIVQVAHHGFWGASDKLYSLINPEVLLWPTPDFWYYKMRKVEQNQFLVHSENVKQIFISNREEVTLNMNKPVPEVQFYKNIGKGEFLVNEDYKAKSILGLNQNCITCGNTGYVAAKAEFTDEGLRLFADGLSVFEIAKPPFMEGVNSYMVSVVAEVKKAGKFGCMVNYNEPSIYSEDEVIDFSTDAKEAEYLVVADEEKKKIEVFKNNESVFETEYIPSERHGVYIVMKDYDIILKKTAVKKLNTDNV